MTARRCMRTVTTDGCEYIAEFDDQSTAAVQHMLIHPDGRIEQWPQRFIGLAPLSDTTVHASGQPN